MQFARGQVPNRHISVHSLVVYLSMQNSLNVLVMAEYVFKEIGVLKGLLTEQILSNTKARVVL